MISELFKVATEFRFEIGSAMLGTQALTGQVDKLSGAADNALLSFQKLSLGVASSFGMTGIMGIMSTSLGAFEDFKHAQLNLVNIFSANKDNLEGSMDSFTAKASTAKSILIDMAKIAREFSLPQKELIHMSELLAPMLMPHGLAGNNLSGAIDLSRKFLKAAPSLGVSPEESTFQLQSAIGGRASQQQTLFNRLTVDTKAMSEFAGQTEKFNKLAPDKRLHILNLALDQFSKDIDVISGRTQLVSSHLQVLKDMFHGVDSVLMPLGNLLNDLIVDFLSKVAPLINTYGRKILSNFVSFIKPMASSSEALIINLIQLKSLKADMKKTAVASSVLGSMAILSFVFGNIFRATLFLNPALGVLVGFLYVLYNVIKDMNIPLEYIAGAFGAIFTGGILLWFGKLGTVLGWVAFFASRVIVPLAAFLAIFQVLSRARAIAKVEDIKATPRLAAAYSKEFLSIENSLITIMEPLNRVVNDLAEGWSVLFRKTVWMEAGLWVLEKFALLMSDISVIANGMYSVIYGVVMATIALMDSLKNLDFSNIAKNVEEAFMFGYNDTLKAPPGISSDKAPVVSNVTNIHGGVKIEMKLKENMEPDRIAFTLIDQLSKAGRNKTQASGGTLSPAPNYS